MGIGDIKVTKPEEAKDATTKALLESNTPVPQEVKELPEVDTGVPKTLPNPEGPALSINLQDPKSSVPSMDAIKAYIDEQVTKGVEERLKAIEANDPSREQMTGLDAPFNNFDQRLQVHGVDLEEAIPGMHLHWVNDDEDRILRMQSLGYVFVDRSEVALNEKSVPLNKDLGDKISVYVGTRRDGQPMKAYLMKISKENYSKRQGRVQAHNDAIDAAIRRGGIGPASQAGGGYVGAAEGRIGIKISPPQFLRAARPS